MNRKLPFVRSASLYWWADKILINPYGRSRDGIGVGMANLAVASPNNLIEIGQKALQMLELCKDNIPDDASALAPSVSVMLAETKQKSWRKFVQNSYLVDILVENKSGRGRISPWRRVGSGYEPMEEKIRFCDLSPESIGTTAMLAFSDARTN